MPRDEWDRPATPRTLGRYELIGTLGTGGMATVYLGRIAGEAGFQRLFAIKVLHPHLTGETGFISMFLDEARIAARLHHPNIVPVVDLGTQGGTHYVAMEYIEGCSLSALLKRHRDDRSPRLLIPIIIDALAGLDAAHTLVDDAGNPMNLVHRDVSPQNILVGIDGAARITDFGIARAESRINSTRPGQLKGKIAYMAPEQIRAGKVDCRADLFSTGIMLWSSLTGRKLFEADSDAATMSNIMELEIPLPSTIGLKPPAAYDAVCLRALERDPDKRYASAQEMEEALREAATKEGALGSRREISSWVTSTFREELGTRRTAIRAAVSGGGGDASRPFPSIRSTTEFPSFTPAGQSDVRDGEPEHAPEITVTPLPMLADTALMSAPSRRKRLLAIAAGAAGAVVLALVLWVTLHGGPSTTPSAAAPEPTETTTGPAETTNGPPHVAETPAAGPSAPSAAAGPPAAPATTVADEHAQAAAPSPSPPPTAREPVRRAVAKRRPGGTASAKTATTKATTAKAATSHPSATPSTTSSSTKPVRWDPDSPVPPQ